MTTNSPHVEWHPAGCMKPNFQLEPSRIQACFRDTYLVGDSSARELFIELESRLGLPGVHEGAPTHANLSLTLTDGQTVDFIWDPYLNSTRLADLRNTKSAPHAGVKQWHSPTTVVVGAGLWHARYLDSTYSKELDANARRLMNSRDGLRGSEAEPIFLPIIPPYFPRLSEERSATLTPERIDTLNGMLYNMSQQYGAEMLLAPLPATLRYPLAYQEDGLHHTSLISTMQLEILTARMCPLAYDHSCCSSTADMPYGQVLAVGVAGIIVCLWFVSTLQGMLFEPKKSSYPSLRPLIRAVGVIGAVMCYCFVADRTKIFERATKLIDEQLFSGFCCLAFVIGTLTIRRCRDDYLLINDRNWADEILPRQQTDEWKGWMQLVILLYHYFGMSHTMWVYRLVRLLVASYLFLTGYGHTSYFIKTNDFSLQRITAVLIRINLLSCVLPFIMGTRYQLYYFPMLASFWFLVTWATIPRTPSEGVSLTTATVAIVCSATIFGSLSTVWLVDGFFALLYHIGMTTFEFREYKFRIRLDFYVPYFGMVLAFIVALARERRVGFQSLHNHRLRLRTWLCLAAGCAGLIYFTFVNLPQAGGRGRERFNDYHPFVSWIPILAYIVLRNATPTLRNHYSQFFAWFGRHSLETFVLQYHIFLAADTHGLLHLGLIDNNWTRERSTKGSWRFWTEVVLITAVFLWVCRAAAKETNAITEWIAPKPAESEKLGWEPTDAGPRWALTPFALWRNSSPMAEEKKLRWKVAALLFLLWLTNACWPS